MFRLLFAFVVITHAMIHFLGFAKVLGLFHQDQAAQPILKWHGVAWFLAGLLFLIGVFGFLTNEAWWLWLPLVALLSQILIVMYWQDAKHGTSINLLIILVSIVAYGAWSFDRKVTREIETLLTPTGQTQKIVTTETIAHLPPLVQKWIERSNSLGKPQTDRVYIKQKGELKTDTDTRWLPFSARQFICTDEPGFVWRAHVRPLPFVHLSARDHYAQGRGNMLIKFLSLITIADESGAAIDQGVLSRFLAEMIWYPSVAQNDYVTWKEMNGSSVTATITLPHSSASGVFSFNPSGDVISFEAPRYYSHKNQASMENWHIAIDENSYGPFDGRRIPTKASVTWKLKSGDFNWCQLEVLEVRYDKIQSKYWNEFP